MKPAFFTDGKTTTHSALSKRSRGIPLSGIPRISLRTSRDSFRRSSSFCCANAGKAKQKQTTSAMRFFMKPPYTSCRALDAWNTQQDVRFASETLQKKEG